MAFSMDNPNPEVGIVTPPPDFATVDKKLKEQFPDKDVSVDTFYSPEMRANWGPQWMDAWYKYINRPPDQQYFNQVDRSPRSALALEERLRASTRKNLNPNVEFSFNLEKNPVNKPKGGI